MKHMFDAQLTQREKQLAMFLWYQKKYRTANSEIRSKRCKKIRMPIITNRTLKHNKFECLDIKKQKHDWLELTYLDSPKWLWEIPLECI